MTDKINEQVSAFVDGELPDTERELLQRRLATDDDLQSVWHRYHLIGDAMREDLPEYIDATANMDYAVQDTVGAADLSTAMSRQHRFMKPLAGLAIAASVASLAIVTVLYKPDPSLSPDLQRIAPESGSISGFRAGPVAATAVSGSTHLVPKSSWRSVQPEAVVHLNSYLIDHSSYSGLGSAQGILPYSRVAGYDEPMPDEKLKKDAGTQD